MREKLIELLVRITCNGSEENGSCPSRKYGFCGEVNKLSYCTIQHIADHLIANGVTVQECGHWVSYQSDEPYGPHDDKEWYKCSKCGKDAYGRCYEDEWYSAPILSDHCHHCGIKMLPQPPKGE